MLNINLRDDSALLWKVCNSLQHLVRFEESQQVI